MIIIKQIFTDRGMEEESRKLQKQTFRRRSQNEGIRQHTQKNYEHG